MNTKKRVYLSQINHTYGKGAFLPYSVGLLQAYALTFPEIRDNYEFCGFFYLREPIQDMVARMDSPAVFGASCYIWNNRITQAFAKAVKEKWPDCLIVLGGPHVPNRSEEFFREHPYADILVHGEGEVTFSDILLELIRGPDWGAVQGITFESPMGGVKTRPRERMVDLDKIPSPYLSGVFDNIDWNKWDYHASSETHRGCPFACSFCDWGSNLFSKVKKFGDERLCQEFEYFGDRKIDLIYNCIAEGTEISTPTGLMPVEFIEPGCLVYGWDENTEQITTNCVQKVVCKGYQDVWRIQYDGWEIDVTENHPIFTSEGWKTIQEMQIGDEVLWMVRENIRGITQKSIPEILFLRLCCSKSNSYDETGAGEESFARNQSGCDKETQWEGSYSYCCCQTGSQGWSLRSCSRSGQGAHENENSGTSEGDCSKGQNIQSDQGISVDEGGPESHEPNDSRSFCSEDQKTQKVDAEILDGSCMGSESFGKGWMATEQIRVPLDAIFCSKGCSLPLFWGLEFLGESLPCWRWKSESGFCFSWESHQKSPEVEKNSTKIQEGYFGSWSILASGQGGSTKGNSGLQEIGLGSIHNLGRRSIERSHGGQDPRVCWSVITDIKHIGRKLVYDLVNAIPSHNFFANGILVSNCDANYAMFDRDIELTRKMIDVKKRKGYPNKFRAAYAKNSGERVFQVSKMLNDAGMSKGATLSFQSMDENTLQIIKRKNIGTEVFRNLMKRYRAEGIPTYSELIIGLPGETYETFANGVDTLLDCGQHGALNCYICEALPNSELSEPAYRERHGIETVTVPVLAYHSTPTTDEHREHYDLIISTKLLPREDWLKCTMLAWIVQAFHCIGFTQKIAVFCKAYREISYRTFYEKLMEWMKTDEYHGARIIEEAEMLFRGIWEGRDWGIIEQKFGNIVWPVEEGSFLRAVSDDFLYEDMMGFVYDLVGNAHLAEELLGYQESILKRPESNFNHFESDFNFHEYLEAFYLGEPIEFKWTPSACYDVIFDVKNDGPSPWWEQEENPLETYAREIVWYGRKGGTFFWKMERKK